MSLQETGYREAVLVEVSANLHCPEPFLYCTCLKASIHPFLFNNRKLKDGGRFMLCIDGDQSSLYKNDTCMKLVANKACMHFYF